MGVFMDDPWESVSLMGVVAVFAASKPLGTWGAVSGGTD